MFDKFGEFNSAEEINRAAKAQKEEGDTEAVMLLAKENGLDPEDAKDYLDGVVEELCTPATAAIGKIGVEAEALGLFGIFVAWKDMLIDEVMKDSVKMDKRPWGGELAPAVRKKGESLKNALAAVLKKESEKRKKIPEPIAKAAGLSPNIPMSTMTMKDQKKTLIGYYLEGRK